ncbi:MAG: hypothetical protein HYZ92_05585 [Candidatus Omnitrophica bacterium]|nr:hypothetical protein [Candidatus Omnitrophota bacterium]
MLGVALRLAWPDLFTPWRSPVLRWRMETYGILDERGIPRSAGEIDAAMFFRFLVIQHQALVRFLRWAAMLER